MNILSAFGNQNVQDNLKFSYPGMEFLTSDLAYQEGILEALKMKSPDAVIINLDIEGELDRQSFVENLRNISATVKVILIAKSRDEEFINWLVSKGVYDVFIDGRCTFDEIYEALKREQKVIIKREIQKEYVQREKVITKEKIIKEIIPVNFRKLILSIWGSSEFGCELAYSIAKLTKYDVLLIDLDGISPKADIYLGLSQGIEAQARDSPEGSSLDHVFGSIEADSINKECFVNHCLRRKDLNNLYILTGYFHISDLEKTSEKELAGLIEHAYRIFDIVVVILNSSARDPLAPIALMKSDYNVAAFQAYADELRDFENYLLHMNMKHNLPLDRIRYVAFEYKGNVHYPVSYLKEIFSGSGFLGIISYSRHRELYRNLNACFARWAIRKNPGEYVDILSKFNIVPKRLLGDRLQTWTKRRIRSLIKAIPFRKRHRSNSKELSK